MTAHVVMQLVGAVLLAAGVAWYSYGAGAIVAGIMLLTYGVMIELTEDGDTDGPGEDAEAG